VKRLAITTAIQAMLAAAIVGMVCLIGCSGEKPPTATVTKPIARHDYADIGSAPALRYTELDDRTAFLVIGDYRQTEHMVVLVRRPGSSTWEPLRGGVAALPAEVPR
jgi:hypothetical protein